MRPSGCGLRRLPRYRLGRPHCVRLHSACRIRRLPQFARASGRGRLGRLGALLVAFGTERRWPRLVWLLRFYASRFAKNLRRGTLSRCRDRLVGPGPVFAGGLGFGKSRGLRLGRRLLLRTPAIADDGQKIGRNLVRGARPRGVMLAQQVHELRRAHAVCEPLGRAVARRTVRGENRRAGFAAFEILGSRWIQREREQHDNGEQTAPNCKQDFPPAWARRGNSVRARRHPP